MISTLKTQARMSTKSQFFFFFFSQILKFNVSFIHNNKGLKLLILYYEA